MPEYLFPLTVWLVPFLTTQFCDCSLNISPLQYKSVKSITHLFPDQMEGMRKGYDAVDCVSDSAGRLL